MRATPRSSFRSPISSSWSRILSGFRRTGSRTSGSRDYRLPPEKCVTIEPDGVTLILDPCAIRPADRRRLARFADELPDRSSSRGFAEPKGRRYLVSPASSLSRAAAIGITSAQIAEWFVRRTSSPPSPALKLLLRPMLATPLTLKAKRMLVVSTPTAEMADGLLQHPATRDLLGERLGPTAVTVSEDTVETLRIVLAELGISLGWQ